MAVVREDVPEIIPSNDDQVLRSAVYSQILVAKTMCLLVKKPLSDRNRKYRKL